MQKITKLLRCKDNIFKLCFEQPNNNPIYTHVAQSDEKKFGGAMSYAMTASPKIGANTVFENYLKSPFAIPSNKKTKKK